SPAAQPALRGIVLLFLVRGRWLTIALFGRGSTRRARARFLPARDRRQGTPVSAIGPGTLAWRGVVRGGRMTTTTFPEGSPTRTLGGSMVTACSEELLQRYREIIDCQRLSWTEHYQLRKPLGSGGQGVVYLSERRGTDNFTLPVAIKVFSP